VKPPRSRQLRICRQMSYLFQQFLFLISRCLRHSRIPNCYLYMNISPRLINKTVLNKYIEYQSVCPFVGNGSPCPPKRVCLPSWTQRGSNTRLRMRGPNSDKKTESLALFIFCEASYINIHTCTHREETYSTKREGACSECFCHGEHIRRGSRLFSVV
jgi:hypothetical protein